MYTPRFAYLFCLSNSRQKFPRRAIQVLYVNFSLHLSICPGIELARFLSRGMSTMRLRASCFRARLEEAQKRDRRHVRRRGAAKGKGDDNVGTIARIDATAFGDSINSHKSRVRGRLVRSMSYFATGEDTKCDMYASRDIFRKRVLSGGVASFPRKNTIPLIPLDRCSRRAGSARRNKSR